MRWGVEVAVVGQFAAYDFVMVPSERSSPRPAPHVQVRKLAPRSAPRAEYTDSGSAAWRGVELRLIAFVAFVVLSIGGLAVRKALVLLGGWTVVVGVGVVPNDRTAG